MATKEKANLVQVMGSKQTVLNHALQQQKDIAAELAGTKESLRASTTSKEQAVQVSLFLAGSACPQAVQVSLCTLNLDGCVGFVTSLVVQRPLS